MRTPHGVIKPAHLGALMSTAEHGHQNHHHPTCHVDGNFFLNKTKKVTENARF